MTGGGEGDASLRVWNPKTGKCLLVQQGATFHESGALLVECGLFPITWSLIALPKLSYPHQGSPGHMPKW